MRQANVLIADPDPLIRQSVKATLVAMGHLVVGEAENGSQALQLLRTLRPEVILLDRTLSSPSGTDLLQVLTAERAAVAIVLTATDDEEALGHLGETVVMGFLSKPFRNADLRAVLPIALARYQERSSLEDEIKSLNERMEARKLVGRAKAILMERHGLSERDAFKRIQSQSIALGKQAHEIAQAIITASEIAMGGPSPAGSSATGEGSENRSPSVRPIRGEKASLDAIQP